MKAKELIKRLKKLKPDDEVVIVNHMGAPAYDYEGQRFALGFDGRSKAVTIKYELINTSDGEW